MGCSPYSTETSKTGAENTIQCVQFSVEPYPSLCLGDTKLSTGRHDPLQGEQASQKEGGKHTLTTAPKQLSYQKGCSAGLIFFLERPELPWCCTSLPASCLSASGACLCVCVVEGGGHDKRANTGTISACILGTGCVSGMVWPPGCPLKPAGQEGT